MTRKEITWLAICVSFTMKCSIRTYQCPVDYTAFLAVFKTMFTPPTPIIGTIISIYNVYLSTSLRSIVSTATRVFWILYLENPLSRIEFSSYLLELRSVFLLLTYSLDQNVPPGNGYLPLLVVLSEWYWCSYNIPFKTLTNSPKNGVFSLRLQYQVFQTSTYTTVKRALLRCF